MATFGNPYDNNYTSTSVQSGKSKRAAVQNQKQAKRDKKRKAQGKSVAGGKSDYDGDKKGRKKSGGGGRRGGGGGRSGGRNKNRGGGGGGGGGGAGMDYSPGIGGITQFIVLAAAICQLIVGIIHTANVFERLEDLCDTDADNLECVGESLFWDAENANGKSVCSNLANTGFTLGSDTDTDTGFGSLFGASYSNCNSVDVCSCMNEGWRAVFTFVPDTFVDNWTPLIFGIIAICQCFAGTQSMWVSGSFLKCLLFHVVMMLFACFGYAGQAGVVIGFIEAFAAFLCFVCVLMRSGGNAYPTFFLPF